MQHVTFTEHLMLISILCSTLFCHSSSGKMQMFRFLKKPVKRHFTVSCNVRIPSWEGWIHVLVHFIFHCVWQGSHELEFTRLAECKRLHNVSQLQHTRMCAFPQALTSADAFPPPDQQGAREYRADQRVGLRLVAAASLAPRIGRKRIKCFFKTKSF